MDKYVNSRISTILDLNNQDFAVKRISCGLTNQSYLVYGNGMKYIFRISGPDHRHLVNEKNNLMQINSLGITNELIYFDTLKGEKLSRYIDGDNIDDNPKYINDVVLLLKKIHNIKGEFNTFDYELLTYEAYNDGYVYPLKYQLLKDKYLELKNQVRIELKAFCHNDFNPSNIILGDQLYAIDFELSGINDPFYDIASFGTFEKFYNSIKLLEAYLGHNPSQMEIGKLYVIRIFQLLRWYSIAIFKSRCEEYNQTLDFKQMANRILEITEILMKDCIKLDVWR